MKTSLRVLRESYAHTLALDFGPLALRAIQDKLVTDGLSRPHINHMSGAIKRVFKWAVSMELLPPTVHQSLTFSGIGPADENVETVPF